MRVVESQQTEVQAGLCRPRRRASRQVCRLALDARRRLEGRRAGICCRARRVQDGGRTAQKRNEVAVRIE